MRSFRRPARQTRLPADGVDVPEGAFRLAEFAAYEGVAEAAFMEEVRAALPSPSVN